MSEAFVALDSLFASDDRSHYDEDTWISLRAMRRALGELIPRRQPRLLLGTEPPSFISSQDFADRQPAAFHRLTSFTPAEYAALLDKVRPFLESPRRTLGLEEAGGPRRGRRVRADAHQRLFLAVHRLRTGAPFSTQIGPFSPWHSQTSLYNDFWHVLGALEAALGHLVDWPDAEHRRRLADTMPALEGCIGLVDATELYVTAPGTTAGRQNTFSGKARTHTVMMQVVVDPYGNIINIDGGVGGRINDIALWRRTDVGEAAAWQQGRGWFSAGEYLVGDCGYGGCSRILMPYRDSEMSSSSVKGRARRVFSNLIRRYRAVNEYIFGVIKARYKMVGGTISVSKRKVPLLFKAAALLVQWTLRDKPLRPQDFYDREELRVTDWEGRCFSHDDAFSPTLVRRLHDIMQPQRTATHADRDIADELHERISVAGSAPATLARTIPLPSPPSHSR